MNRAGSLAVVLACAAGCSSSSTDPSPAAADAGDLFATNGASGVFIDRAAACDRYLAALEARASTLACTLDPAPKCPDVFDELEKDHGFLGCFRYDEGTIANCEGRIASYAACGDFTSKPCALKLMLDTTGKACSTADAGADTSTIDSAVPDSSTDPATTDAGGG